MTSYISIRRIMQSWYFLPLFLLVLVFGCQEGEVESLFDKSASQRSQESISELRRLLKSSEYGWVVDYQPDTEETGYYGFIFKFTSDTLVETSSNFSAEDITQVESEYNVF